MSILTAFNTQLVRFFEELSTTFPEEREIKMAVEAISAARKINPRLVLDMFYEHVYKDNAQFIYDKDIQSIMTSANKKILTQFNDYLVALTIFNKHWHNMSENNRETVLNYLTVICKLCERARAA